MKAIVTFLGSLVFFVVATTAQAFESHTCFVYNVRAFKPSPLEKQQDFYRPADGKVWLFTSLQGGRPEDTIAHIWEIEGVPTDFVKRPILPWPVVSNIVVLAKALPDRLTL